MAAHKVDISLCFAGAREVREQVHSSMYKGLRTNLPREVMSYTDFPFTRTWMDSRRFCGHQEVPPMDAQPV